jgi:cyclophilin family peptidyl-prolyl cis-trans isomerase
VRARFQAERKIAEVADDSSSDVQANALLSLAVKQYENEQYKDAVDTIDRLKKLYGDSYLASLPSTETRYSLVETIRSRAQSELEWNQKTEFENPAPDTKITALVETTKGDFWMGFFPDYAPEHVKNFIARAKAGEFNGTQVYSISSNAVDMGGKATLDDDPKNDAEPEKSGLLEPEKGRFWLEQRRGRISSVAFPEGESPDRFTVVVGPTGDSSLNKQQTVFGEVLRDKGTGLEALDAIGASTTYGSSGKKEYGADEYADLQDHPITPIRIERISIWENGKIAEGHTWDTSAVTPPEKKAEKLEGTDEGAPAKKPEGSSEEKPAGGTGSGD